MKKWMIFLTASLSVSAMVMYMYNTAASALTEGNSSGEKTKGKLPEGSQSGQKKSGGLQESAVQRNQDPDTHSAANSKPANYTRESNTGNVD